MTSAEPRSGRAAGLGSAAWLAVALLSTAPSAATRVVATPKELVPVATPSGSPRTPTARSRASMPRPDGVGRELAIRVLALRVVDFVAPPADAPWWARYDLLEALRRRTPGELNDAERAFARAALADAHPNVRATVLLVHAAHELPLEVDAGEAPMTALAVGPLPTLRIALARALFATPGEAAGARLLELTTDSHADVAREARLQLLARPRPNEAPLPVQRAFLLEGLPLAPTVFFEVLDLLERTVPNPELVVAWHARLAERAAASGAEEDRARLGLVATLPGLDAESDVLAGWGLPLPGEAPADVRRRRRRFERYLEREPGSGTRTAWLLARSRELWEAAEEDDVDARWDATELLRFAVASHAADPQGVSPDGARPDEFAYDDAWGSAYALAFWEAAGDAALPLDREARRALEHVDGEVRAAAVEALGRSYLALAEADAESMRDLEAVEAFLIDVLADPVLGLDAYAPLVRAERALPGRVHAVWRSWDLDARLRGLEEHAPDVPRPAWRDDLIHLWDSGAGRTTAVVERLGDYRGDALVEGALYGWILEQVTGLAARRVPPESERRGPWRDAESRALALLGSWLRVRRDEPAAREAMVLMELQRRGKELGKRIIAETMKREGGPVALRGGAVHPSLSGSSRGGLLHPDLRRRMRVEIVLLDDGITGRAAAARAEPLTLAKEQELLDELFVAYDAFDEELRLRVLRRAAGLDRELARARLLEVALDAEAAEVLRRAAVESLATAGAPEVVTPLLERVLREVGEVSDHDLRRAAVRGLGVCTPRVAGSALAELQADEEQRALLGDVLLPALVRTELRAPDDATGPEVRSSWIRQPRGAARDELEARFVGERLAARDFVYAGWLDAARALARAGVLKDWLRSYGWTFDGRLLARLAEVVRDVDGPGAAGLARRLDRAALVALQGEGAAPDRDALLVRQRARLLQAALAVGDRALAARWARRQLDAWNGGRVSGLAWRSTYDGAALVAPGELAPRHLLELAAED